ncbi:MAG: D-alanine--D-alanine ligase family protein, partial [Bacteroidales bacterium]
VKRLRIGVIYGGRSGEHEISIASAAAVVANLDRDRYEAVPLYIERDGRWTIADRPPAASSAADVIGRARTEPSRSGRGSREAYLVPHADHEHLVAIDRERGTLTGLSLDVVFPVLHGPYGEDGTVQGLLEIANVPYVGAGVMASAVGMDKAAMKMLFQARGLPVVEYVLVRSGDWQADRGTIRAEISRRLGYPVFVKPVNLGSSVGISKVKDEAALDDAIDLAAQYDRRIIVEAGVPNTREIECSVLGNDTPEASVPGEILPSREFYDYEAKYLEESEVRVPADLPPAKVEEVRRLAVQAFLAIDGAGMGRVDFLLDGSSERLFVNEINTIPGFTTISMYPKLWMASGLPFPALLDRLVELALERHAAKQQLRTSLT